MADEDDFLILNYSFPPDPVVFEKVDGKITCDLTSYDPPPKLPSNICSNPGLQVLKLFKDNFDIPKALGSLHKLEQLVLCQCENDTNCTKVTKVPKTLGHLENLKLLDLRNNVLQTFPPYLSELSNLEELHVNNCQLASLPNEFANFQKLKTLDISNNFFTELPLCVTKLHKLSKLYVSDGRLQTLCREIKSLVNLERLQLTSNELTSLPEELFQLVGLKKLYLNNNKLTSLHHKVGELNNLEFLVLNQNKLTKIPETIGKLKELCYLNVHENMLSFLPESIINLEQIETLLVNNNPLQVPPVHVCNQGIQSIQNYFQARRNTGNFHSKRLKVVVVGESMAGKTSLVDALMKGTPTEIRVDERTLGVVFFHWKPEPHVDELELVVVDCAGQKKYQMTHQLFISEGALFVLAVHLPRYTFESPESYQEHVGQWISMIGARISRARILVVPTHIDECRNQEEIDLKCKNILTNMKEQREEMAREIDNKSKHMKTTERHCVSPEEMAKILEKHQEQKDNLPFISLQYKEINENFNDDVAMTVTPVSNTKLDGMVTLRKELVRIARNKNLSPYIDRNLPESWVNMEKEIAKYRKTDNTPCLSIVDLQEVLKERGIDVSEYELCSCVSYLDAIGELQYFKKIDGLVKNVVINPYWICSVLRQIFRHDMDESLKYNDSVRKMDIVPFQFDQDKQTLLGSGVMTQTLLRCVWAEFLKESDEIFSQLIKMLTHFGLACEMPAVGNDIDAPDGPPSVCYLIPWFFKNTRPKSMSNQWPARADAEQVEVTAGYALPQYVPVGLFQRFSVLCHKHEPVDYEHWRNGFYMKFDDVLIESKVESADKCGTLKVAGRAPRNQLDNLWRTLLILLEEVKKLLNEWPGLNFVPFTVCPKCVEIGLPQAHHFRCNWFKVHKSKREAVCNNRSTGSSHEVQLDLIFPSEDVLKTYRMPVMQSDEVLDCVLRNDLLDEIAELLGTRWQQLCRKLNLRAQVRSIRADNRDDTHEQAVEMLTKWKQERGTDAKVKIIVEALRELKFNDVADFIYNKSRCRTVGNSTNAS